MEERLNARPRPELDLSPAEKTELREVFNICDSDESGGLDWREMRDALRGLGFAIRKREAKAVYAASPRNHKGFMEFEGFLAVVERLSRMNLESDREIKQVFPLFLGLAGGGQGGGGGGGGGGSVVGSGSGGSGGGTSQGPPPIGVRRVARDKITIEDLRNLCVSIGEPLPDSSLRDMIQEADLDGDGAISAAEFVKVIRRTNLYS